MPYKKIKKKESFYLYLMIYLLFIIRYFILKIPLGYGLGDLVYIILFSCFLLFSLLIIFKVENRKILLVTSILNILMSIYILLMMFVFIGIERGW
jgi:hypothetical protein